NPNPDNLGLTRPENDWAHNYSTFPTDTEMSHTTGAKVSPLVSQPHRTSAAPPPIPIENSRTIGTGTNFPLALRHTLPGIPILWTHEWSSKKRYRHWDLCHCRRLSIKQYLA